MKSTHLKLIGIVLLAITFAACGKTVTNIVPGPNTSTSQAPTAPSTTTQADSGGVINGGGGKGVRCMKDGKETIEVLDLYEAKSLYNLSLVDFGNSEDVAKNKLAQVLAHHFWNPYTIPMDQFAEVLKKIYIQEFLDHIRFIDSGKKLRVTNDSYEPTLESGCEPVQIATYYDESVLLIDKTLWLQMDWTNKMALLAHEALYFLARQSGTTNSMGTRKLVGMLFSTKAARPVADSVPSDRNKFVDCRISAGGFSKGHFFLYRSELPDGHKGLEAVFADLGNNGSLFRTSSFLSDLSFVQLGLPKFGGVYESELLKDTYPTRDRISLAFKGILDGQLRADLRILRGASTAAADALEVSCPLPSKIDELEPQSTIPGEFEQKLGDGSVDILKINSNGSLTLEQTRQVGGNGGISNFGVVPYPTTCRYKDLGMIRSQDQNTIEYLVVSSEIGDLEGLKNADHCKDYVDAVNRKAADGSLRFTLRKSEYSQTK